MTNLNVLCELAADGGFTAVDLDTGISAYAYPTSRHAVKAKRQPVAVAREMIRNELRVAHLHDGLPGAWAVNHSRETRLRLRNMPDAPLPARLLKQEA